MKKEIQKELEEIAPFLATLKEQPEGYTVPKHFFNNMRIDIMNKVQTEMPPKAAETQKITWWTAFFEQIQSLLQPKIAVGFATLLLAFVGIFYFFKPDRSVENVIVQTSTDEQKEIKSTDNQAVVKNETIEVKKTTPQGIVEIEKTIVPEPSITKQESVVEMASMTLPKLEDASDEDLNAILDELLENEDFEEEEISEEIR